MSSKGEVIWEIIANARKKTFFLQEVFPICASEKKIQPLFESFSLELDLTVIVPSQGY